MSEIKISTSEMGTTPSSELGSRETNTDAGSSIEKDSISNKEDSKTKVEPENEEQLGKELMIKDYTDAAEKEGILSLNAFEIRKNFKKSYEALVAFMEARISNHIKMDEETVVGTLIYAPRQVLYDFFDDNKLFINIHGSDNYWKYTFVANSNSDPYTSRASAEKHGFMEAFQILNSQ